MVCCVCVCGISIDSCISDWLHVLCGVCVCGISIDSCISDWLHVLCGVCVCGISIDSCYLTGYTSCVECVFVVSV